MSSKLDNGERIEVVDGEGRVHEIESASIDDRFVIKVAPSGYNIKEFDENDETKRRIRNVTQIRVAKPKA